MIKHIDNHCSIMWGNATDFPVSHKSTKFFPLCEKLRKHIGLEQLVFPLQVHGTNGFFWGKDVYTSNPLSVREYEGDFIITDKCNVGIGVLTADCLPITFYFPQEKIIAAVHAGWRGTVGNICKAMLEKLNSYIKVDASQARIFFGPAAQRCCYQVSNDFLTHLENFSFKEKLIYKRYDRLFFDNTMLAIEQLKSLGFSPNNIDMSMHHCTMCTAGFHSYRKSIDKEFYKTQGTIVWIQKEASCKNQH